MRRGAPSPVPTVHIQIGVCRGDCSRTTVGGGVLDAPLVFVLSCGMSGTPSPTDSFHTRYAKTPTNSNWPIGELPLHNIFQTVLLQDTRCWNVENIHKHIFKKCLFELEFVQKYVDNFVKKRLLTICSQFYWKIAKIVWIICPKITILFVKIVKMAIKRE